MNKKIEFPVVHMKCRRGDDSATHGQSCKGMQAENLSTNGAHQAQFRCTTCKHVWTVPIGGTINI